MVKKLDQSTFTRRDGTKFLRTSIWCEYGYEAPLQKFITELTNIMQSIPEQHRSKAMFEESTLLYEGSAGKMEIYYDEETT